jgi:DNA-binding transcriptional LysR family regulator
MRFHGLNLNLLAALQVLLAERNVSVAAQKLHLSQSSVSGMLSRLREHYGDQLLELSGRNMVRTPFADSLVEPLDIAMQHMERLTVTTASFTPSVSRRQFRIVTSDYMIQTLLPHAMSLIVEAAPHVTVAFDLPAGQPGGPLNLGNVDLMVAPEHYSKPPYVSELFCEEDFVLVGWAGNPILSKPLKPRTLRTLRHAGVQFPLSTDPSITGYSPSLAQVLLGNAGYEVDVAIGLPTFATAFAAIIGTDLITITHRRLANTLADRSHHIVQDLPIPLGPLREALIYHPLRSQDAGLIWLKGILREALGRADETLPSPLGGSLTPDLKR